MKLVVGLGNPGRAYAQTRHNVGWLVLDALAGRHGATFRRPWLKSVQTARMALEGAGGLLLVKPLTFMNRSGSVLPALMRRGGLGTKDLIVVADDVNLPLGKLRIRIQGGAGGHNGLKSVIAHVGGEDFTRLRIGIGEQEDGETMTEHVLGRLNAAERQVLADAAERAAEALEHLLTQGAASAMNRYN
ncbi:MAG: aminoacyl-tRNA hydrolase [Lentisphaerae bacterium]|jgi:PTH1 family peptidyl-tRNA hydrolase|nr:aminoacyl-tRNA hydrolase [Lentisphaerota bacterium]